MGRRARMSYAAARAGRRWFCEGSLSRRVQRRRRRRGLLLRLVLVREEVVGMGKGSAEMAGIEEERREGTLPVCVCVRARVV